MNKKKPWKSCVKNHMWIESCFHTSHTFSSPCALRSRILFVLMWTQQTSSDPTRATRAQATSENSFAIHFVVHLIHENKVALVCFTIYFKDKEPESCCVYITPGFTWLLNRKTTQISFSRVVWSAGVQSWHDRWANHGTSNYTVELKLFCSSKKYYYVQDRQEQYYCIILLAYRVCVCNLQYIIYACSLNICEKKWIC